MVEKLTENTKNKNISENWKPILYLSLDSPLPFSLYLHLPPPIRASLYRNRFSPLSSPQRSKFVVSSSQVLEFARLARIAYCG
ncbi:hypothetical protein AKJ16_DCAP07908 [Drosera capensis]